MIHVSCGVQYFFKYVSINNSGRPRRRNYWKLYILHFAFKGFKLIKVSTQLLAGPADSKQNGPESMISTPEFCENDGLWLNLDPNLGSNLVHSRLHSGAKNRYPSGPVLSEHIRNYIVFSPFGGDHKVSISGHFGVRFGVHFASFLPLPFWG